MPLYNSHTSTDFRFAIWRISEEASFFNQTFLDPEITNTNKQLQWLATRHLVNQLCGRSCEVIKDEFGKPSIRNSGQHISITHTAIFAGAILSEKKQVGIDLEMITPKVQRIAQKFLYEEELKAIHKDEIIEKLILYWSAKEALYKLHGRKQLEFKTQLLIEPFSLNQQGQLRASIRASDLNVSGLTVHYQFFEDHVLTYVAF